MEIYDAHAHIYPTKIAKKATDAIGGFYDIRMETDEGTAENLIKNGAEIGVKKYLVHSVATTPKQVRSINEFIRQETLLHEEFIGFMTLHPDLTEDEISEEIEWALSAGLKGIKLHPDFQKFDIDEERAEKIYRSVENIDAAFPVLFHTGDDRYEFSKPFRLANMAIKYPRLRFIGAHFGGYRCWDEVGVYEGLDNVFFDTSSSLAFITPEKAGSLIKKFGAEKFFFGTDFPMWTAREELDRFMKIDLNDGEREKILAKNLKNFLGL